MLAHCAMQSWAEGKDCSAQFTMQGVAPYAPSKQQTAGSKQAVRAGVHGLNRTVFGHHRCPHCFLTVTITNAAFKQHQASGTGRLTRTRGATCAAASRWAATEGPTICRLAGDPTTALQQCVASVSHVHHRSQQGQNGSFAATAATGGCPTVRASLHGGSRPDDTQQCWGWFA